MTLPDWATAWSAALAVPDAAVDAAWRALNHLCVAQLYLDCNIVGARPLQPEDVRVRPAGHWGVCPPVNWLLAQLGPLVGNQPAGSELLVLHGAGHAGPSAFAHAYLTDPTAWSRAALTSLVAGFGGPDRGGEITPLVPGVRHTGGQLGAALAVGQGMVLDAPHRLVVPLVGDGECETGGTAAAWLARRALLGTGQHGAVLPVVLCNGLRMGGPSLLGGLEHTELVAYFTGLGYRPLVHDGADVAGFRTVLGAAVGALRPLGEPGPQPVVVLTMPKGSTGPVEVAGRRIAGTAAVHKTPLLDPRTDPAEFAALRAWLSAYRPRELFDDEGAPAPLVQRALPPTPPVVPARPSFVPVRRALAADLDTVLVRRAQAGGFRVFSPDELRSNRLLCADGRPDEWVVEILNEELCHAWLQGYTETGRAALLPTYEAFAPINASLLAQHLKHRLLRARLGETGLPSVNYLLTSLGWQNTYTHQNPGLVSVLLDLAVVGTHIYTPADAGRAAHVLAHMVTDHDHCNVLVVGKHPTRQHPTASVAAELHTGAALWPWLGRYDTGGEVDLVLASAGDVPATELTTAAELLHGAHPRLRLRYVHVHDLTVLGPPATWPHALPANRFAALFGRRMPVLLAVPGFPGAVRGLLAGRHEADRFHVVGYRDPGRPVSGRELLAETGMSGTALAHTALTLVGAGAMDGSQEEHR